MSRYVRTFALIVGVMTVLAACSSSGASSAPSAAAPSAAAPSVEASAPAAGGATLALADSALGKIVVDGQGKTLYMFEPDDGQAAPTCTDACAGELAGAHRHGHPDPR